MFDSIVNDDVQYPASLPPDAVSIIQKVTNSSSLLFSTSSLDLNSWLGMRNLLSVHEVSFCDEWRKEFSRSFCS